MNLQTYSQYRKSIEYCTFCPKMCRFACPVALAEARETVTPSKKMEFLYLIGGCHRKPSPELIEAIYKCTGCLHCFTYCGHKNMIMHVYYSARNELKYCADDKIRGLVEKYSDNYRRTSNPFGDKFTQRFREMQSVHNAPGRNVLFFSGCTEANFYPETTERVFRLIKRFYPEAEFIQSKHYCCGYPLLNFGLMNEFIENARIISQEINRFKIVITNCPACAFILKSVYSGAGITLKPEILTLVETISGFLNRFPQTSERTDVIYHDPCYLSRYQKIIAEPRRILQKLGYSITEYEWNGIDSECCGASVAPIFPELSSEIAKRRLSQMDNSIYGKRRFFTSCPSCRRRFSKSLSMEVYDVADEFAKMVL